MRVKEAQENSVLVLGDGNFSFSMALAQMLRNTAGVKVVATSFDSEAALHEKYPEAASFISRIHACGGCVYHSVDATSLQHSLPPGAKQRAPFAHIVFHHPHVGEEHLQRHIALLGHFLWSAAAPEFLAHRGCVHVSLGGKQPVMWQLQRHADRHQLLLLLRTAFPTSELRQMSYEKKRHQAGRAFEGARLRSTNFTFGRARDYDPDPQPAMPLQTDRAPQPSSADRLAASDGKGGCSTVHHACDVARDTTSAGGSEIWPANGGAGLAPGSGTPRRGGAAPAQQDGASVDHTTGGRSPADGACLRDTEWPPWLWHVSARERRALTAGNASEDVQMLPCPHCTRRFACLRGFKQHVHMVHELKVVQMSEENKSRPQATLTCERCGAAFRSEQKLAVHECAAVDAAETPGNLDGAREGSCVCQICGLRFKSETEYLQHLQWLRPHDVALPQCGGCGRHFADQRALQQHRQSGACCAATNQDGENA